ncbi:hypothetical protein [Motiliproteus sp.]|uniref:hypothetical protein n=1 Tax=Motiliproteus sp. TaxID=1898955 RepID=UPI003BAAD102
MKTISSLLFSLACFATATLSAQMMGAGLWFWIIITAGLVVGASLFSSPLTKPAVALAGCLSVISVGAILLGLVAATIGGSFNMDGDSALLLSLFAVIAISGAGRVLIHKRELRQRRF